jgi:transketolase
MRQTALKTVYEEALKNEKVIFIGSDLGPGVLDEFKQNIPERFFMEGVAEQFIIGFSAGLAKEGFLPFVNTIATFLTRRCFEQLTIDLSLHNLPVKLIGNGGGLVYSPLGPTHQAIDDIAILKAIPNMTIVCPCDAVEMKKLINKSIDWKGPIYIRLARGGEEIITNEGDEFSIGKSQMMKEPIKNLFITCGAMAQKALEASRELSKKFGIESGVLHMHTVKPIDEKMLKKWIPLVDNIVTVEEHILSGGFGSSILEFYNDNFSSLNKNIRRLGLINEYVEKYGTHDELQSFYGLTSKNLVDQMLGLINENK